MMDLKIFVTSPFLHIVKRQVCELLDSDDELDDEVNLIMMRNEVPRTSIINFYEETVPCYSDDEFIRFFRLSRNQFFELAEKYEKSDGYQRISKQHLVTSADKSLAVFLWFCAHEAECFRDISNLFNISISTVFMILRRLISFLSSLAPTVITWPMRNEMKGESEYHLKKYGIPGVIGAVDGTHIRIDPPAVNKDDYVDRKGDITMVVQAVCNHENKFIHAAFGYPGSVHDARVFHCSDLPQVLQQTPDGYRILGDSAYPCLEKLMPPYRDNGCLTAAQKEFNYHLSSSRVMIEHSFGILKQRFRQLYYCKLKGNRCLCHIIMACMVLHNISKAQDLDVMEIDPFATETVVSASDQTNVNCNDADGKTEGKVLRNVICAALQKSNRKIKK